MTVDVRYAGAAEWYRLRAADVTVHDARDHQAVPPCWEHSLHHPGG
ncbi:hypothetical protein AB0L00_22380 [Actinoallomurus sp. NPDC052308]